ncbi:PGF-CTERM-anchored ABC transporter substrate-binding protein [Halalkalicoccus jeotgali]|uniref:Periplasmic binding protein n=1 Tax=Halalkalicoccus jeotgali (strain DSM 18796 / CECT 7217 / JCM 14584 / KCTC 4019 / B3) TaxID=795797 RepID=D8J2R9_HALJB|nr:PGF-CTERM-anchored ABC transporter substrate-binding protein [Halalkalicoccus jeotgali]ADJ15026.1 periplasmic binding protein [Halalkalicoccus jeotgali B3]ELY34956.1 periplasmic binding protein [Halalkalicoccus jeotgali B3]
MRTLLTVLAALLVLTSTFGAGAVGGHAGVAAAQPACEFPVDVTDATGEEITLEEEPERIVAMQPSDAQTLWEIGAREKVVGMPVSQYTEYLEGYDEPTDITADDGVTVNTEEVIELDPDLALASAVADEEQVEQLRDAGITVYQVQDATSVDDVRGNVETYGQLTGECAGAAETIDWMDEELGAIENAVEGEDRPTVLFAMGDGYTAGQGTFIEDVIETAGGENLASAAGIEFYGQISEEVVVSEDPDWIVYPDTFEEPPVSEQVIESTTAGQEDQIVQVDSDRMNQPGPQVVLAVQTLAETFHPDVYAAQGDASGQEDGDGGASADGEDQPGFGIVAAVAALVAAGFLFVRRR